MKPPYLDRPGRWQYAPRTSQSEADYGCAIEHARISGYAWHDWAILAVLAVVLALAVWGAI
jgi:hypothetical protein